MNDKIFSFFYNFAHRSEIFDQVVIFVADTLPYIVVVVALFFLLVHHEVLFSKNKIQALREKWKEVTLAFITGAFAWLLADSLKTFFANPRPFIKFSDVAALIHETGFAFPSGHATFFMTLGMSIYLNHKKAGSYFIIIAILIGLARIVAGVHFPVDILGGFILGIMTAYFVRFVYYKTITSKKD